MTLYILFKVQAGGYILMKSTNHVICKEQRSHSEAPKRDNLLSLSLSWDFVHEDHKQNLWQKDNPTPIENMLEFLLRTQLSLRLYKDQMSRYPIPLEPPNKRHQMEGQCWTCRTSPRTMNDLNKFYINLVSIWWYILLRHIYQKWSLGHTTGGAKIWTDYITIYLQLYVFKLLKFT